jgi:hypothetical protein
MTCAVCCSSSIALKPEPLGRDGRDVLVCFHCRSKHPRSGRYSFDGVESPRVSDRARTARKANGQ